MALTLLTGGARSGKSSLAVAAALRQPAPVVFVATAQAGDAEMAARIAAHRRERPAAWTTVEEPLALGDAIAAADPGACLVVDCLALWAANVLAARGADAVVAEACEAACVAAERDGPTIVVTNEVGMGVVPATPLGRTFRDVLGTVNAIWSRAAGEAFLVVAGRRLRLEP